MSVAVFPYEPERDVYNNALLDRYQDTGERTVALDAMEAVYASAAVIRYAAWVGTLERARRRGLGTAITAARLRAARLRAARDRGMRTASLQATPVAERLYASLGFRDFGRFIEYVPRPGCAVDEYQER